MSRIETEAERQFYLSALGVRLWYARASLPGAAPTPSLDFSEAATVAPVPPLPPVKPSLPEVARPDISQIMEKAPAANKPPVVDSQQSDAARTGVVASEASTPSKTGRAVPVDALKGVSIDFGFWWNADICLISCMSNQSSITLQSQLAVNILASLDCTSPQHHRLRWPVFNNPRVPEDAPACLTRILQNLGSEFRDMKTILWLGISTQSGDAVPVLRNLMGAPTVDFDHSLAALASDYQCKRTLWNALRQLNTTRP